jgi:hypothetical protein
VKEIKTNYALLTGGLLIAVAVVGLLFIAVTVSRLVSHNLKPHEHDGSADYTPARPASEAPEAELLERAVEEVKEDRREPAGRRAQVAAPGREGRAGNVTYRVGGHRARTAPKRPGSLMDRSKLMTNHAALVRACCEKKDESVD